MFLDGDYSDYPQQMDRLVRPIASGKSQLVIGSRTVGGNPRDAFTTPQRLGTALACTLLNIIWRTGQSDLGPFRAIDRSALASLNMTDKNYGWTLEMQIKAARGGLAVREVPVSYRPRIGQSKISGTLRGVIGAGVKILFTIGRYALSPPPSKRPRPDRLIVFTRYPVPGRAKTRLIPALGSLEAARLQRRMTEQTIDTIRKFARSRDDLDLEVRFTDTTANKMRNWLGGAIRLTPQQGQDLGQRLAGAMADAFTEGCKRVVIIGTDCPSLSSQDLQEAFDALDSCEAVIGPSTDGGYWLIGTTGPFDLFENIQWSTPTVFPRTMELADRAGLSVKLLCDKTDIDTAEDLQNLPDQLWANGPWLSIIVATLNEQDNIEACLKSAQVDKVELIVVDGESCDATAAIARQLGAEVISCRPGRAGQMNHAGRIARGEVLLFLHGDTILGEGFEAHIFDALSDRRVVAGAFKHKTDLNGPAMGVLDKLISFRSKYLKLPFGDQAIFVRREQFEAIGGYEDVPIAEDLLLIRKLSLHGLITTLPVEAVTSGRRWRKLGLFKTTLINQLIIAGCLLGVRAALLARLYR